MEPQLAKKIDHIEVKVDNLEGKVDDVYIALQGNNLGTEGIVPMLKRHMNESKKNFDNFTGRIGGDYAEAFGSINESIASIKKSADLILDRVSALEGHKTNDRVIVLESHKEKTGNRIGFIVGISASLGAFVGGVVGFLIAWFK